jgi:hypothetical protein
VGDAVVCADGYYPTYAELAATVLPNTGWGRGWRIDAPGHFGISCSSKSAWTAAVALGLGERSRAKRVPVNAFALPREEKLALLAGYFDADGTVAKATTSNHGRGHIASVARRLVEDLRELAISCTLEVTPVRRVARASNFGEATVYSCTLTAGSTAQLPLWHEAKAANLRATSRQSRGLTARYLGGAILPPSMFARRVRGIQPLPPEPVRDLFIQHLSRSFIVEGVPVLG